MVKKQGRGKETLFRLGSLSVLLILLGSCSNETVADNVLEVEPIWEWELSDPLAEGINPAVIDSIHKDISDGKYGLLNHMFLVRNGKIVVDNHYEQDYEAIPMENDTTNHQYNYDHPDWHPYYNNTELHSLQSVTKSITTVLVGIAVDEGYLAIDDTTIMNQFSDFNIDKTDQQKMSITVEDLLSMRSGIEWDEEDYEELDNDCVLMELSDDWIQFVLDKPMDTIPGSTFKYNGGATVLLGKILREVTGKRMDEWAEEKLFAPLGITEYYWKETPMGEIDTEGGLYLKPKDFAKIGLLMLNKGKWENEQIVSKNWVEKSIEPTSVLNEDISVGYVWWILEQDNDTVEVYAALGYGGQYLMIAPRYNMFVVFNCWNTNTQNAREKYAWFILQDLIIPGSNLDVTPN
ncbi:MAG: serine hydrolase [Crocinitomix sp.]|nr:serine hydrolase [Crocinitomix sp.]